LDNRFLSPEPTAFEAGQGQHRQIYSARYRTNEQVSFEKPTAQGPPLLTNRPIALIFKSFQTIQRLLALNG
jgi:hypothetical protein